MLLMSKRIPRPLCDEGCNNCTASENKQVALLLNVLALRFGEEVWGIANSICANLTVCPVCRIDDFCHDTDEGFKPIDAISRKHKTCDVAKAALRFMASYKTPVERVKEKVKALVQKAFPGHFVDFFESPDEAGTFFVRFFDVHDDLMSLARRALHAVLDKATEDEGGELTAECARLKVDFLPFPVCRSDTLKYYPKKARHVPCGR